MTSIQAVSYTHLDVYKRQVLWYKWNMWYMCTQVIGLHGSIELNLINNANILTW